VGWTCIPTYYNSGNSNDCDCGCGIRDPDCTGPTASACDYCEGCNADGSLSCTGSPVNPTDNSQCTGGGTSGTSGTSGTTGGTGSADYCQTCASNADCASGEHCLEQSDGTGACTSPCSHSSDCPSGAACYALYNSSGTQTGTGCFPVSNTCGQSGGGDYCQSCTDDSDCSSGFCAEDDDGDGYCAGIPDVDDNCPMSNATYQTDLCDYYDDCWLGGPYSACFPSSGYCN